MKRRSGASGFTLIEVCVAIAIVALGIMTAMAILVPALRWAGEAQKDFTAAEAALTCANYLCAGNKIPSDDVVITTHTMKFGPFVVSSGAVEEVTSSTPTLVTITVYTRKWDPTQTSGGYSGKTPVFKTQALLSRE